MTSTDIFMEHTGIYSKKESRTITGLTLINTSTAVYILLSDSRESLWPLALVGLSISALLSYGIFIDVQEKRKQTNKSK